MVKVGLSWDEFKMLKVLAPLENQPPPYALAGGGGSDPPSTNAYCGTAVAIPYTHILFLKDIPHSSRLYVAHLQLSKHVENDLV